MKMFAAICISIAAALAVSPLPKYALISRIQISKPTFKQQAKYKISFEEEMQFVFNLKSQLYAGVNQMDALVFALSRSPDFAFVNTKQALTSQANVFTALQQDSITHRFPLLASCANLLDLSLSSGCSINEALGQLADKLINRRKQEQLISTELASTKATVFVLACLPITGAGIGLILGTDSISWLLGSSAGRACLVFGLGFELAGWLWIKRLLNRALADVT